MHFSKTLLCLLGFFVVISYPKQALADFLCVSESGSITFYEKETPRGLRECEAEYRVLDQGINMSETSWNRSASYDSAQRGFTTDAAGNTFEYASPGEHLLMLDYISGDRRLYFSLNSNRAFFSSMPARELDVANLTVLLQRDSQRTYVTTGEEVPLLKKLTEDTSPSEFPSARLVRELSNSFVPGLGNHLLVDCFPSTCPSQSGWIPRQNLADVSLIELRSVPFSRVIEFPTRRLFKGCGRPVTTTTAQEFGAEVSSRIKGSVGTVEFEVSSSLEETYRYSQEVQYSEDLEIEWTVFTILNFVRGNILKSRLAYREGWLAEPVQEIVVALVTRECGTDQARSRYEIVTENNTYALGEFRQDIAIDSYEDLYDFERRFQSFTKGSVANSDIRFIASSLSTDPRH